MFLHSYSPRYRYLCSEAMAAGVACERSRSWSEQYVPECPSWGHIFRALDVDDSGHISVDELLFFGRQCEAYWADWPPENLLELAGASSSATGMTMPQFVQFADAAAPWGAADLVRAFVEQGNQRRALLDPFDPARIEAAFKAVDIDDSGYIELSELLHFGSAIGAGWSQAACEALLGRMDTDGDRKISLSEFETFVHQVGLHGCQDEVAAFIEAGERRREMTDPYNDAMVRSAFRALDINDSGYIELSELLHFGSAIGAGWSQAACEALLGRMDTDGDRKISFAEFDAFVREVGLHGCHGEVSNFVQAGKVRRALSTTEASSLEEEEDTDELSPGMQSI